ncbi:helix-turn-helix transcriptional regulator [Herbidospora sp. NBRC 101105]|uniref:helix-turn-helix domain-containing protein n=1 Tax=Herbidospora sp. NBRC 101105 TaxID=3032195 RepID=UPI0024A4BE55|nr:helix-turn-helix transcriptional regulator [Herbidospora sp. NBRC 101105]GLX95263.1 transcriptional regulator [Herbidospora sp. NBRC 101105]
MANDQGSQLSPRQRFGRELSRVRKNAGLSQKRLGAHVGVSPSLIGHIELGNRSPSRELATACDEVLGTGDIFVRLYRNISTPAGPHWFLRWVEEIEPRARVLRSWNPLLVSGLLQTENYARAVFRGHLSTPDPEVEEQVRARMHRTLLLDLDNAPELWFLLDEWVVRRPIGGPEVMVEQLEHLIALTERRNITIQLVPVDSPCTDGLMSAFTIAELAESPTTVQIDSTVEATVSADPEIVSEIWSRYDRLRAEAYRPGESLAMIKKAVDQWTQQT